MHAIQFQLDTWPCAFDHLVIHFGRTWLHHRYYMHGYPKEFYSFDYHILSWEGFSKKYKVMIDDQLKLNSCGSCGLNVQNAGVYLPYCVEGWKPLHEVHMHRKNSHAWPNCFKKIHMHGKIVSHGCKKISHALYEVHNRKKFTCKTNTLTCVTKISCACEYLI